MQAWLRCLHPRSASSSEPAPAGMPAGPSPRSACEAYEQALNRLQLRAGPARSSLSQEYTYVQTQDDAIK